MKALEKIERLLIKDSGLENEMPMFELTYPSNQLHS